MILPFLSGIKSYLNAPVTWLIFFINLFVMIFTLNQSLVADKVIDEIYSDELFLQTQGELYSQYVLYNNGLYSYEKNELARKATYNNDVEKLQILGSLGIRDKSFLDQANSFSFKGDQVLLKWWRKKITQANEAQKIHPSYFIGLNSADMTIFKWVSYQFAHSGVSHFLGNMLFLLLFGCVLEPIIGGLGLLVTYLATGMVAAGVFLYLSGVSSVPLIGASGAVSGVMALFCFMFWRRPVRYIYFLFIPKKGYAGYVFLPGWITMAIWLLSDLAGYIGTSSDFGGIAYSAHLGGEAAGMFIGLLIYLSRKYIKSEENKIENYPESFPVGTVQSGSSSF